MMQLCGRKYTFLIHGKVATVVVATGGWHGSSIALAKV